MIRRPVEAPIASSNDESRPSIGSVAHRQDAPVLAVQPSADNRALVIEVESGSHYSSSEVFLEGEHAPRSRSMFLKNLPAGDYQVVATLRTKTGAATIARNTFQVVSERGND